MTEEQTREVAVIAAGLAGQPFDTLPPQARVRWIAEVTAAINGGQDETTVGQAVRKALHEYQQPKPEPVAAPVVAKAPSKKK